MRPVTRPPQPDAYPPSHTLTFKGANAVAIAEIAGSPPGTKTFTLEVVLQVWLLFATTAPGSRSAALKRATGAISNRIPEIYKAASTPLTQGLGPFCSYCESPLSGLLEVEHCVPKAPYPTYAVNWENFLLACSACNICKTDKPDRETATAWTGVPNPTEEELYQQIRIVHYFFPDLKDDSYGAMPIYLYYYVCSTGQWEWVPDHIANNPNNFILSQDVTTRTVVARLFHPDNETYEDHMVAAYVYSETGEQHPDTAQEMIDLCGLNICKDPQSTHDRRVMNRTIAWFTALMAIKHLLEAGGQPHYEAMWIMLKYLAVSTGFYSNWVRLLVTAIAVSTAAVFVDETLAAGMFPGTNTEGLPSQTTLTEADHRANHEEANHAPTETSTP